jgi:ubiquinone/menaquinone biosynthesis C-methylase UbiE
MTGICNFDQQNFLPILIVNMPTDSTTRFSNRVEDYVKYRPSYPTVVADFLQKEYNLPADTIIADIGAGTGISSQLFLSKGYAVVGVEPNKEMLAKALELLGHYEKFTMVPGTAEQTLLKDGEVNMVIAGQAYHWFNVPLAKKEFERILKPHGIVALIWNERLTQSPFEQEYDQLITHHARDYVQVDHRNIDLENIQSFFQPHTCKLTIFPNYQDFDFAGLKGRLLSSSYMPAAGENGFDQMIADLATLFNKYQHNNNIRISYDTKLYSGYFK